VFPANAPWLVLAAVAFTRTRGAGALASAFRTRATTGRIRAHLIPPPGGAAPFTDTAGSPHEPGIRAVAAAGSTTATPTARSSPP
jgi:hypothetical protein